MNWYRLQINWDYTKMLFYQIYKIFPSNILDAIINFHNERQHVQGPSYLAAVHRSNDNDWRVKIIKFLNVTCPCTPNFPII
jgi:hypothetical protein